MCGVLPMASNLYLPVMKQGPAETIRSLEVHPEILEKQLGQGVRERLAQLHPTLIAWDLTEEHTSFFLDHRGDLMAVLSFVHIEAEANLEAGLPHEAQWYLRELRRDLREIIESGAVERGIGSHFAVSNRPSSFPPVRPQDWTTKTIAFIEALRPSLAAVIKPRYIDQWLQMPHPFLGGASPLQVIEGGQGEHVRDLVEQMRSGFSG